MSEPDPAAPGVPAPARRVAFGLAYDGSDFAGFAAQPGQRTVAGLVKAALERLAGEAVELVCAGRTDKGVHALAQVIHVDLPEAMFAARRFGDDAQVAASLRELPGLARAVDRQLGPEVSCWRAMEVPAAFDARRSAVARRYRYELDVAPRRDPQRRHTTWRTPRPVDLALLRLASDPLIGEHDFAAFCRRPPGRPCGPITRRVLFARWKVPGDDRYVFEIEAQAFCHQMVRAIVGALVAAGSGRLTPSDIVALLRSGQRRNAPALAPANGLCLTAVRYPEPLGGTWGVASP